MRDFQFAAAYLRPVIEINSLFQQTGAVELSVALTALVIGSALLTLSAFWTPIRSALVMMLPGALEGRLPASGRLVRA